MAPRSSTLVMMMIVMLILTLTVELATTSRVALHSGPILDGYQIGSTRPAFHYNIENNDNMDTTSYDYGHGYGHHPHVIGH